MNTFAPFYAHHSSDLSHFLRYKGPLGLRRPTWESPEMSSFCCIFMWKGRESKLEKFLSMPPPSPCQNLMLCTTPYMLDRSFSLQQLPKKAIFLSKNDQKILCKKRQKKSRPPSAAVNPILGPWAWGTPHPPLLQLCKGIQPFAECP